MKKKKEDNKKLIELTIVLNNENRLYFIILIMFIKWMKNDNDFWIGNLWLKYSTDIEVMKLSYKFILGYKQKNCILLLSVNITNIMYWINLLRNLDRLKSFSLLQATTRLSKNLNKLNYILFVDN